MTEQRTADEHYYIGEVVDWLDPGPYHPEVTIISPRHWITWEDRDNPQIEGSGWGYDVLYADDIKPGVEVETNLRRKRTPPSPDTISTGHELEHA